MWDKMLAALRLFPNAVLTWADQDGYPASVRIHPEPDESGQVLRFDALPGMELHAGPASLMSHSHNEETWNLKSFLVRGRLEEGTDGWHFRPLVFISGAGLGSPIQDMRQMFKVRPAAKRHLTRRSLKRPTIPWDKIKSTY